MSHVLQSGPLVLVDVARTPTSRVISYNSTPNW